MRKNIYTRCLRVEKILLQKSFVLFFFFIKEVYLLLLFYFVNSSMYKKRRASLRKFIVKCKLNSIGKKYDFSCCCFLSFSKHSTSDEKKRLLVIFLFIKQQKRRSWRSVRFIFFDVFWRFYKLVRKFLLITQCFVLKNITKYSMKNIWNFRNLWKWWKLNNDFLRINQQQNFIYFYERIKFYDYVEEDNTKIKLNFPLFFQKIHIFELNSQKTLQNKRKKLQHLFE